MKILSLQSGHHDATAAVLDDYQLLAAVQLERLTRHKGDGGRIPDEAIDEVLDICGIARGDIGAVCLARGRFPADLYASLSALHRLRYRFEHLRGRSPHRTLEAELIRAGTTNASDVVDEQALRRLLGVSPSTALFYYNHHDAHALSALFHMPKDNVLAYTADGRGDNIYYSFHHLANGRFETLYGGDGELLKPTTIDSLGQAYGRMTRALGFKRNRHEGKLTGLAAYGAPKGLERLRAHFRVDADGRIHSDFDSYAAMDSELKSVAQSLSREDAAATIQQLLEDLVLESVRRLLDQTKARHLALAGGIFANVRLNRLLYEETEVDSIFVFPGMGDEGIPVGGAYQYLMQRDGLPAFLERRRPLSDVYLGRDHKATADATLAAADGVKRIDGGPAATAAQLCANGWVGAIYRGRMEFGPRALGNRSVIGSPADAAINDRLNQRLNRSEFMPFAPVVLAEDAGDVFEIDDGNAYACRFMTITTAVRQHWRDRIPAVVHVDGTARPQIIDRDSNPTYADTVRAFRDLTGLPVMINTSFNAHEEPIIDTPAQCLKALQDDRIDFVLTDEAVYSTKAPPL